MHSRSRARMRSRIHSCTQPCFPSRIQSFILPVAHSFSHPVEFGDGALRRKLKDYSNSTASINGVLKHDQAMLNTAFGIIATPFKTKPPYTPYVAARYRSETWFVSPTDNERAILPIGGK